MRPGFLLFFLILFSISHSQENKYPQNYFRHPLNIPMEIVGNFGELRTNHWHMGLDIRTQQKQNLPVYASAEGYISRVSIEPGGFGRTIYINHPNGYTTVYAHLNNFEPRLHQYVKEQQYKLESWEADLVLPPSIFPVRKGDFIAYSGNTGASAGPHVHFEIRKTANDKCVNPLLFGFPLADNVLPSIIRLAMYDRTKSVYHQTPNFFSLKKLNRNYIIAKENVIRTDSEKISFAITAFDRLSGSNNPIGIYSARLLKDDELLSEFLLDDINYDETRYMNAHIDYRMKLSGGAYVQHLSKMPGDTSEVYSKGDGIIHLDDTLQHKISIQTLDHNSNISTLEFYVQKNDVPGKLYESTSSNQMIPGQVNVFETPDFELFTSEYSVYDTVHISYSSTDVQLSNAISKRHSFSSHLISSHDFVTVRIKTFMQLTEEQKSKVVILCISGNRKITQKAQWNNGWVWAKFRNFGSFQAYIDDTAPVINSLGKGDTVNFYKGGRFVFTPTDNFNTIKNFRAELNGNWLMFTNDKGRSWVYSFDERLTVGIHELKILTEDVAGNITEKSWWIKYQDVVPKAKPKPKGKSKAKRKKSK